MAKVNRELISKIQNTEKTELKVLNIDGEAFEFNIQTRFTNSLKEKTVSYLSSIATMFQGEEGEGVNYFVMTATLLSVFTDIEVPEDKAEMIEFIEGLLYAGVLEKILEILEKNDKMLTYFTSFIMGLGEVVTNGYKEI